MIFLKEQAIENTKYFINEDKKISELDAYKLAYQHAILSCIHNKIEFDLTYETRVFLLFMKKQGLLTFDE